MFTAAALILPGCVVINAVLGAMSFLTSGPLQYAGTVYSVSEYTYEYAVNDKTPDEVIEDKLAWLLEPDEIPEMTGYAKALRKSDIQGVPQPDAVTMLAAKARTTRPPADFAPAMARLTFSPKQTRTTAPVAMASAKPTPALLPTKKARPRTAPPAPAVQTVAAKSVPQHIYIKRDTDPLREKLTRMEQGFALAERMAGQEPPQGVRYSLPTTEVGINGSWSIRHGLMQLSPAPSRNPGADTAQADASDIVS